MAEHQPVPSQQQPTAGVDEISTSLCVIQKGEVQRFLDMGLGRGVDATRSSPWSKKGPIQVRPVVFEHLMGTEHGGVQQIFEREVSSVHVQMGRLKSSILVPNTPVNVGIDAEMSRSYASTVYSVGRKVTNRTVSFKLLMEGKIGSDMQKLYSLVDSQSDVDSRAMDCTNRASVFEQKLSSWIMEKVLEDEVDLSSDEEAKMLKNPMESLAEYAKKEENREKLREYCNSFIHEFHVTHYVASLELGAQEYSVVKTESYKKKLSVGTNVNVAQQLQLSGSFQDSLKTATKSKETKKIGIIGEDGRVKQGSMDEAVVGISMLPVTTLITNKDLYKAMQVMLLQFLDKEAQLSCGPFIISCSDKLFWTVDEENLTVEATSDISKASSFYIHPDKDRNNVHDQFKIEYIHKQKKIGPQEVAMAIEGDSQYLLKPVPRYLCATSNICGRSPGPLQLRYGISNEDSELVLIKRTVEGFSPAATRTWINSLDMFYIRAANAKFPFFMHSYICVKKCEKGDCECYTTACVPSIKYHDEKTHFMLFRLLPASVRDKRETFWRLISGNMEPIAAALMKQIVTE